MNAQQIASRIGELHNQIVNLEHSLEYHRSNGDWTRADQVAEAIGEARQELHELQLANSER